VAPVTYQLVCRLGVAGIDCRRTEATAEEGLMEENDHLSL
jgi:hypothetical protein